MLGGKQIMDCTFACVFCIYTNAKNVFFYLTVLCSIAKMWCSIAVKQEKDRWHTSNVTNNRRETPSRMCRGHTSVCGLVITFRGCPCWFDDDKTTVLEHNAYRAHTTQASARPRCTFRENWSVNCAALLNVNKNIGTRRGGLNVVHLLHDPHFLFDTLSATWKAFVTRTRRIVCQLIRSQCRWNLTYFYNYV